MRKLFIAVLALGLLAGGISFAEENYVVGGFEASGHIISGAGWQRWKTPGGATAATTGAVARDVRGTTAGVIGAYTTATRINQEDDFKFFVDEIELDVAKSFGENIRLRADFDFGSQTLNGGPRFATGGGAGDDVSVLLEQAYVTANVAIGNGVEVLVGRFNAPIGFEKNDVNENDTISRSTIYRALRPISFTGAKFYYSFSDLVDWSFFIANNSLNHDDSDVFDVNTDIPAFGTRLGFNWGEEGKKSNIGVSGAVGQDHGAVSGMKKHISFLGDADFNWWATDNFALGGEAIYRQINRNTPAGRNAKYYGGLLNLHYDFSDVWDGTLKYAFTHDNNGNLGGTVVADVFGSTGSLTGIGPTITGLVAGAGANAGGQIFHELALAGSYAIADGAKLKLEGGYTLNNPEGGGFAGNNRHVFGLGGAFAYEF